ncbi:hypothetical protein DPMN_082711 [Dreissena polymorpha]|uniref:Uncharacterized protein n=1 Tax=Dreissena polymorpha TaxID=45954 RepID=A0A9D3YBG2_DREPO|nr:hypothetical protein DPMN_082711 [Dreissena polymorpha]
MQDPLGADKANRNIAVFCTMPIQMRWARTFGVQIEQLLILNRHNPEGCRSVKIRHRMVPDRCEE